MHIVYLLDYLNSCQRVLSFSIFVSSFSTLQYAEERKLKSVCVCERVRERGSLPV